MPPLPITGIILRLTHTGKAGDSVYITDLGDGTDTGSYRKVGPVYVPRVDPSTKRFPGYVDLPYANDVHLSHRKGGIRSFLDTGYLVAEFFFGPLMQQAAVGQAVVTTTPYTVRPGDRELHVCTAGPVTIQLPPIAEHQTERVFILDARGTAAVNPITVLPAPGETVLGGASAVINSNYGFLDLFANCPGTNWFGPTGGGGGVNDHTLLLGPSLVWSASGHTGTPNTIAAFNGAGVAVNILAPSGGSAPVLWGVNAVGTTTTTRYLSPGYDNGLAQTIPVQIRAVRAGTFQKLRVRHNVTAGNGNPIVYTLRVNGIATALSVSMLSTAVDGSDLVNTVAVAAGDLLDFRVTKAAGVGASPTDIVATVEFV